MTMLPRRMALGAIVATVATIAGPLAGTATAATFSGTISTSPAAETSSSSSTNYVYANRPTFVGTYTGVLNPSSTITVKDGATTVSCPTTVSGSTVSCRPAQDLVSGHTYAVTSHGVQASDGATADAPAQSYVDAHPTPGTMKPTKNGTLFDTTKGISVTFTDPLRGGGIDSDTSKSHLEIYDAVGNLIVARGSDVFSGAGGNPVTGTTPNTTITVKPSLAPGARYEARLHVDGVDSAGADAAGAFDDEDYFFYVNSQSGGAPKQLAAPTQTVNNQTVNAIHLSGVAAPGLTVNVFLDGASSANATTVVPSCNNSPTTPPSCPWSVTYDGAAHTIQDGNHTWTAQAVDANGVKSTATSGPSFNVDTSAPAGQITVSAPDPAPGSTTIVVSAQDGAGPIPKTQPADTDIGSWQVTVSDPGAAHTVGPYTFAATGGNTLPQQSIDVSALDDGTLNVTVTAVDYAGNVGTHGSAGPVKNAGFVPDFSASSMQVKGTAVSFPEAQSHPVFSPTSVTVTFKDPITPSWTDGSDPTNQNPPTYSSSLCVFGTVGSQSCLPGSLSFSGDSRSMTLTFAASSLADAASPYEVFVTAWPANFCHDLDPIGNRVKDQNCVAYNDLVKRDSVHPFQFTVDNAPPATPTVTLPTKIDATGINTVGITGTGEPGSFVKVTVKSDHGQGVLIANPGGQPTQVGSDGTYSMVSDFTSLADGVLTVTATATDQAGNTSGAAHPVTNGQPAVVTLAARPSAPAPFLAQPHATSVNLFWGAPTATGGSPVDGYVLTYQDKTLGTDAVTATPEPTPSQTSYPVTGLVTGHSYLFTLCATNAVGGPCNNATVTAVPAIGALLTASGPAKLVYPSSLVLSGRLTATDGPTPNGGIAGKQLTITRSFDDGTTGTPLTAKTDNFGYWSLTISKPAKSGTYVVSFNKGASPDPMYQSASKAVRTLVAPLLKITKLTTASSSHLYGLTISGTIAPAETGQRIYLYAKAPGTRTYKSIGWTRVTSRQTWAFGKTYSKGTWYVYAVFPAANGNAQAVTPSTHFTRT